jgi:hypothetical protein
VTGYFYAANQQEINGTVCRLNNLIVKISNARTGLLYASVLSGGDLTLEVNINLNERR